MGARALKILGRVTVTVAGPLRDHYSFEMDDFLTIFQGDYRGCKFLPGVLRLRETRPHASVIRAAPPLGRHWRSGRQKLVCSLKSHKTLIRL